ncbi:hypothetical protein SOVF_053930 [Spinacia oleracea]|nr:hypothetical protein SOVF_053930 [Spinacia oleracea]
MSLHLANLSPRMRKDELERVFKKFGRCTVQLKDGYGFAVYDIRGDAEKALRTLKGKKICGEVVYLSWSNNQPKPLQRFTRAARSHDTRHGRNSDRGANFVGRGDYSMSNRKQPDKGRERHKSAEIHDDRRNFNLNDAVPVYYDKREAVLEEDCRIEVEPNQIDNGRWGEQVDNLQNGTGYDVRMGFDRYDPDRVDGKGEIYENHGLRHFACSHSVGTSPDKNRRVRPDKTRGHLTCFKCGAPGHKMRDCPLTEALQEKSTYPSQGRHDLKAESEVGRVETRAGIGLQSCIRDPKSARQPDTDKKLSRSGKDGVNSTCSPVDNESRRDKRKYYNSNRERERDDQIVESHADKKSRVSAFSRLHSDCTSPELGLCSGPSKPLAGLNSHFKTGSPGPHSVSARSRSNSRSGRSMSNSRLHRSSPLSKEVPTEVRQHDEPEVKEENLSIANKENKEEHSLSGHMDNLTSHHITEVPIERKQSKHDPETLASTTHTEISLNGFVEDEQIPQYHEAVFEEKQRLELGQNFEPPPNECVSSSGKVIDDLKLNQELNDADIASTARHEFCEVEAPSSSLLEKDDNEYAAVKMSAEELKETEELENDSALETIKSLEPANNSDLEAPSKLHVGSHLSISAEELSRVLKHYGLKHPEDSEQHVDVGDYFGSSRVWPWEMIYYRRLKKGPISLENYARRVAQNEAFRITDKYIRSSSGWGESIEEHH